MGREPGEDLLRALPDKIPSKMRVNDDGKLRPSAGDGKSGVIYKRNSVEFIFLHRGLAC